MESLKAYTQRVKDKLINERGYHSVEPPTRNMSSRRDGKKNFI